MFFPPTGYDSYNQFTFSNNLFSSSAMQLYYLVPLTFPPSNLLHTSERADDVSSGIFPSPFSTPKSEHKAT